MSIFSSIVSSSSYIINEIGIVNFPLPNGDVHRSHYYGVDITQLFRFAILCSNVSDFNRNRV